MLKHIWQIRILICPAREQFKEIRCKSQRTERIRACAGENIWVND